MNVERRSMLPARPTPRGRGRPAGSLGEVAQALLAQAAQQPGTARELSRRALVGDRVGMYTASRLASAGLLVRVLDSRPAVFSAKGSECVCLLGEREACAAAASAAFEALAALFARPMTGGAQALETA